MSGRDRERDRQYAGQTLRTLGALLREELPPGIGFAVQLFATDDGEPGPGWVAYASTAEPTGVAKVLRQMADDLEAGRAQLARDGRLEVV
jgi:hypothetical protein